MRMRLTFLMCCPEPFKCGSTHCRATYLPWVGLQVSPIRSQLPGFGEVGSSTWSLCSSHLLKPCLPLVPSTSAASFPYPGNLSFIRSVSFIFSVSIIFSLLLFMEEDFSTVFFNWTVVVLQCCIVNLDFPGGSDGKASVYNVRDLGSIPGLGRFPGEGNGNPLQYSCLENPMDEGAWCRLLSTGLQRLRHDWATSLSLSLSLLIYALQQSDWVICI